MNRTGLRSRMLLAALALLAVAVSMAWHHYAAAPIRVAQEQLKAQTWLSVLPANAYDNSPLQHPIRLSDTRLAHSTLRAGYRALLGGQPSAVVLHSRTQGYGGALDILIAIDPSGRLMGLKVLQQQETPGLGAQLVEPGNTWLQHFIGHGLTTTPDAAWALKRDNGQFDQLAGASVTSRAVIQALHDALRYFDEHAKDLLEGATDE